MEKRKFMVVTDNSAGEINMNIIAEHSGPAFGQASSFCAEGYGMLSALSFFRHTMEYTVSTTKLTFQMYLDNKG
eukprot:10532716-Ditylum_brightwellii.AAC.1